MTTLSLLHQADDRIRFAVDDVEPSAPSTDRGVSVDQVWQLRLNLRPWHTESDAPRIVSGGAHHGLLTAVHHAYARHAPLVLTPDVLALTLHQGLARHLREAGGGTRPPTGRETLDVAATSCETADDWRAILESLDAQIRASQGDHLEAPTFFSTTTPTARMVGRVNRLYAFKRYYDYVLRCICGIPAVELRGTVDDWHALRAWVTRQTAEGLEGWLEAMRGHADQWVASREGEPDVDYWRSIYKDQKVYGASKFRGWIADLFPYLGDEGPTRNDGGWVQLDWLPSGILGVPIHLQDGIVSVMGGIVGFAYEDDEAIVPALAWAVTEPRSLETCPAGPCFVPRPGLPRFRNSSIASAAPPSTRRPGPSSCRNPAESVGAT
ncbi:MAG: DUF4419 domain-containing protein [Myxococcota bacterium]